MTLLSVNLNKIALLRNSRGRDYPGVIEFALKFYDLGVRGITIHPRQDERHITRQDAVDLGALVNKLGDTELNMEGYPSESFLSLVEEVNPSQCTLVPDSPDQLTSDHGWDLRTHFKQVSESCDRLKKAGIRTAIFLDPNIDQIKIAPQTNVDRLELYTERFAATYRTPQHDKVFNEYREAANLAQELMLGINAGHDLDLSNLSTFLEIEGILEVSIGHALTVECIEKGMEEIIKTYLKICSATVL
jgi:pyridoxine 5-phosphate synthase